MSILSPTIGSTIIHDVADFMGNVVIADIPGKGRGLLTTTDIPAGTLLLASKAFALGVTIVNVPTLLLAFDLRRKLITPEAEYRLIGEVIRTLHNAPQRTSELYQLDAGELPRIDLADGIIDPGRIEAIVSANCFGISMPFDSRPENMSSAGLWILPSFINHSCAANALRVFYGDVMMIRATQDLRAGEEIVISYRGCDPERRKILKEKWGIECDCAWCKEEKTTPPGALQRRDTLITNMPQKRQGHAKSSNLARWVKNLDATYRPKDRFRIVMIHPLICLMKAFMEEGKANEAIATGRRVLQILPITSFPFENIEVRMMIAQLQFQSGNTDEAKETLIEMLDIWWQFAGITLRELKVLAIHAMKNGDPAETLLGLLRELEEEQISQLTSS
jgi:hypothetical protein